MAELLLLIEPNKIRAWGLHQVYPTDDRQDIVERLQDVQDPESFLVLETNSSFEYLFFNGAKWLAENEDDDKGECP